MTLPNGRIGSIKVEAARPRQPETQIVHAGGVLGYWGQLGNRPMEVQFLTDVAGARAVAGARVAAAARPLRLRRAAGAAGRTAESGTARAGGDLSAASTAASSSRRLNP